MLLWYCMYRGVHANLIYKQPLVIDNKNYYLKLALLRASSIEYRNTVGIIIIKVWYYVIYQVIATNQPISIISKLDVNLPRDISKLV